MLHRLKFIVVALSILVPALFATGAGPSGSIPHKEHCVGTITSYAPGAVAYTGQGVGTQFGQYTIVGSHAVDEQGNIFNGTFTSTAADGSTIHGIYTGSASLVGNGVARSDLHVTWLGGTGRFDGVVGQGDVVCFHGTTAGSAMEYSTEGTLMRQ
jgi:hypothetical protein